MLKQFCLPAVFLAAALPAFADQAGQEEYMTACAVCHGESGMGAGPMAEYLNVEVPGLTTMKKDNDGVFPFLETFMVVDGRTGVRGHGSEMMPIWGDRYKAATIEAAGEYGAETIIRGRIYSLVLYLESIQE
jgi:hypothetical protein